ncbi:MAG: hypothetical protein P1V51_04765 [Deltaproteobacteria bacterium]|nr:hypothetical protein [Deltaproteobacteria bacterium]
MKDRWGGVLAGLVLGLAGGLGVGWLLWASGPPAEEQPVVAAPVAGPPEAGPPPPRPFAGPVDSAPPEDRRLREELARLQRELTVVQQQLQSTRAREQDLEQTMAEVTGPIPFPPDLPERFGQEALRQALDAALEDVGGEVVAMDCSEHPCLAFAKIAQPPGQPLHLRLREHPALAAYREDSPIAMYTASLDEDGEPQSRAAFAFVPDPIDAHVEGSEDQRLMEHVSRRLRAWTASLVPPRDGEE